MKSKRYMVVAIRHFSNGEHHWMAPIAGMKYGDEPFAFGAVCENGYGKPSFDDLHNAENWAMSMLNGEWALAQWEETRPTFVVVDEKVYVETVERDSYPLPDEAEAWSDAKVADFERECDCNGFKEAALWDSDTDEERGEGKIIAAVEEINAVAGLSAWTEDDGLIAVEKHGEKKEAVADAIEAMEGFPREELEWVSSDEASNIAYFRVK